MPIVGFAIVYTISHSSLGNLAALLKSANTDVIPSLQGLAEMRQARNKFGYYVWASLASQEHPEKVQERVKIAKEAAEEMKKAMEFYESFPFTPPAEEAYAPARKVKEEYLGTLFKVVSLLEQATPAMNKEAQALEAGNSLSQSSTEAAASLEETVAALEEMTSMVQMNSDNAKQAAALSASSKDAAETGEHEIQTLITSMTEISQSSKKIEEIISVIDDIAFQTNLLALNAAVEAARAGEQGKGFAVVAEAVRSLAQRSASSAKDISSLIKTSVEQIGKGSQIADKSGTVLTNIVTSIKKVSDLNNEIAAASSEQTTGIQQIGKAMNQLDQASQSNAASAEEIAATSGEINNLAMTNLRLTVELNQTVLGGDKIDSSPVPMPTKSADTPRTSQKSPAKIIAMRRPANVTPAKQSAEMIPFDEDTRAKVGSTDGF